MWQFVKIEFSWRAGFPIGYYLNSENDKLWITVGIPFCPLYFKYFSKDSFEVKSWSHWS